MTIDEFKADVHARISAGDLELGDHVIGPLGRMRVTSITIDRPKGIGWELTSDPEPIPWPRFTIEWNYPTS